jgi:hypothetical protein
MSSQLDVMAVNGSGTYTYSWTSVPEGFSSDVKNPVVFPSETTAYLVNVNDGTQTITVSTYIIVQPVPLPDAGADTSYCWWVPSFPVHGNADQFSHVKWTTSGDGHFDFDTSLYVLYYPGDSDRMNRSVKLKLIAYAIVPCSDSVSDEYWLTLIVQVFRKRGRITSP